MLFLSNISCDKFFEENKTSEAFVKHQRKLICCMIKFSSA